MSDEPVDFFIAHEKYYYIFEDRQVIHTYIGLTPRGDRVWENSRPDLWVEKINRTDTKWFRYVEPPRPIKHTVYVGVYKGVDGRIWFSNTFTGRLSINENETVAKLLDVKEIVYWENP